jgi:hypothetical protein
MQQVRDSAIVRVRQVAWMQPAGVQVGQLAWMQQVAGSQERVLLSRVRWWTAGVGPVQ